MQLARNRSFIAATMFIFFIITNVISTILNTIDCRYSNYSGTFTFQEVNSKERNFDMCLRNFFEFKKQNKTDTVLYRLCEKHLWQFWNWGTYLKSNFRLPYKPWPEIESRRGPVTAKSGFQDF